MVYIRTTLDKGAWFCYSQSMSQDEDIVQLLVTESVLRAIEENFLKPAGLSLSGRIKFSEDDLPTYIIDIGER